MDISWGHHKNGLFLGVISMHFRVFYCQGTEREYFWEVDKISNTFGGMPDIPDIFRG